MSQQLESLVNRLESAISRLEKIKLTEGDSTSSSSSSSSNEAPSVSAYKEYVATHVQPLVDICNQIGGECVNGGKFISDAFAEMLKVITLASIAKKPSDDEFGKILTPLGKVLSAAGDYRFKNNKSEFYNHLYSIEEGLKCLVWPTTPAPVSHVKEMVNAAQFYNNKILMAYKNTDKAELHRSFVNQFKTAIEELAVYVKEYHMSGLAWNAKASQVASAALLESGSSEASSSSSVPSSGGAGVPPPPSKMVNVSQDFVNSLKSSSDSSSGSSGSAGALFAEIASRKDNASVGLKHVTKDMKTKYQTDKPPAVVPGTTSKPTTTTSTAGNAQKKRGTPKFERDSSGKKWQVEWQSGAHDLKITDTAIGQSVYIYQCNDTMVEITGKVNNIVLDKCTKTCIVLDSVVSGIELVNCQSCQVQVRGAAPTLSIDKTDGAIVYLSKESIHCRIVTAKSSEMNIVVPDLDSKDDDIIEIPLPEQFVNTYDPKTKKFHTELMKHE
ncbi:hypothetical protein C9374_014559 [Naegleria lovaniensis]|uniref:Adenylyl cyclase-associated protein n=1 Tax=Naegleria lovaniensis TaxID=51637 RepID=A0AA88H081_NAELO|nr:uncharacterized protein C9374_014559 [Naegleria lovaniensis]KAG2389159.1 hypothetical protein C9374_014559 [Naegleria lovaniensis]